MDDARHRNSGIFGFGTEGMADWRQRRDSEHVRIVLEINVAFRPAKGRGNRTFRGAKGDTY
ncbi:MAG: hypothetical protein KDA89_12690 [Planctomycetaceae bacterium]|nr:hypothetical protein [Planctomycetaceae bacterium]